jgi:hypothetical protein
MSKHLVDMASKQKDVMFNMLSLKHKLLIPEKECEKWYVIFLFLDHIASCKFTYAFNFVFFKFYLLISCLFCFSEQYTKDWLIINVCHHLLCINCANIQDGTNCCQLCNITFDPNTQVSTVTEMKIAFSQVEDLVWKVIALE